MRNLLLVTVLAIILLLLKLTTNAQPERVTYLEDPSWQVPRKIIDIRHLEARLSINPYDTLVSGKAEYLFSPMSSGTDSIKFHSPDITFSSVKLNGKDVEHKKNGHELWIYPSVNLSKDEEYRMEMEYTAKPIYDLFHIGWSEPATRDNKQIWAHRPFHWLPYSDDRLTVDMHITFDSNYMVFSNGVRESVADNEDGTRTWHYKMYKEHPFFSTALVIGRYDYLVDTTESGIPLELWYYPWNADHSGPTYMYTSEMFSFFEDEFGFGYPYELYREAPVEDYLYGAMETTTSTVFGDYLAVDERAWDGRNYVNVNAHELAHQWFGNCLSHLRNRDVWLTESFATYYAKIFEKHVFGDDYYDAVRDQEMQETFMASEKDGYPVGHGRGGRARWYPKGSLVMDMLRDVLGENDFKASIQLYLEKNAFSEVETAEFLAAIREATGRSMEWFFDQWICRGGEPHYNVYWSEAINTEGLKQTVVEVRQVHKRDELIGLFSMPVNIDVYYDDGSSQRVTPLISEEFQQVHIDNKDGKAVSFVLFDPGRRIIKKLDLRKDIEELSAQLLGAPLMIDRYDALLALREFPLEEKLDLLREAWDRETFHLTRGEIIRQAGPENIDGWQQDPDPLVRRAAIQSIDKVPAELQKDLERFLEDRSYINVEMALDLLCHSFPEKIPQYLEATKDEVGWRGRNIRMKWLEIAIGQAQQKEALMELVDYTGPDYEFETRIRAFQTLKKLNYLDDESTHNLIDGCLYWNYKVSNAAKEALEYFYQQNKHRERIDAVLGGDRLSPWQVAKVRGMLGAQ
jgi:aminopeptidase N